MKVAVLLSGGVDSSVAMRLALDAGHDVHAFYLKIWLEDELASLGTCPWEDDLHHARAVCHQAGVPLEVISLQRAYHRRVVAEAIETLAAGGTPSPDILCNRRIKFGAFFDTVDPTGDAGFARIVSGHYARIERDGGAAAPDDDAGTVRLARAADPIKDQTYFLYRLDQHQLARCSFPLGRLTKAEVRRKAEDYGLSNRHRPDSQGICFLGKVPFDDFVRSYLGDRPGEIHEHHSGRRLGTHRGLWFHTIGQRKGLGLGGGPWYVVGKDVETNVLRVVHADALSEHRRDHLTVPTPHWIAGTPPDGLAAGRRLHAKLRHGPAMIPCSVTTQMAGGIVVALDQSDAGIAAGQSVVLYDDEICLGGGVIG